MFIFRKISTFLFPGTYSLQSQANCMALTSTTSAKSQHDKQIKQTLTWGFDSLKLLLENTVFAIVLHIFSLVLLQNLFLTSVSQFL